MSRITMQDVAVMSVQYVQYSFAYYLDSMKRCGLSKIDMWGGAPHYCRLDYNSSREAGQKIAQLRRAMDDLGIYDIVEPLYARVGRPSIDPVLLVKMLLLGYLYSIPSERKLEQEVRVNIAFRWFLGIDFDEPVPDHSTISQLRRRKFGGTTLFQDIFDEVVRKCMAAGLVTGKLLLTDSTHILANAAKEKREIIEVPDTPSEYVKKLDREALELSLIHI